MASDDYIAVTGDDWYQRRRQDAEGEFFRRLSEQAGRGSIDPGGSTRQGIYCFTAGGRLLAFKNAGQNPDVMREVLRQGLRNWQKLPASERQPGAVEVPASGKIDSRYTRTPPANGLIVNVHARCLDRGATGDYTDAVCAVGRGNEASRDHLWLTEREWKSLVPTGAKPGERFSMTDALAHRIARFHLVDNTRGEPPFWSTKDVRAVNMTLIVEKADAMGTTMRVVGAALLSTTADAASSDRGYDSRISGQIHYDAKQGVITRFDLVAVGDHWGEGSFTRGARPGRTPLGVAFERSVGRSPADRVPPQAAREVREYFGPDYRP